MNTGEPLNARTADASTDDERSQASMAHALALIGLIVPFVNIIAPLIIWVNDKSPNGFVKEHARESLNFQITMIIVSMICVPLCFLLIGFPMLCAQYVFELVVVIQAAMAARRGERYLYPLTLRLLK